MERLFTLDNSVSQELFATFCRDSLSSILAQLITVEPSPARLRQYLLDVNYYMFLASSLTDFQAFRLV
jgi:hypothetical protein